MLPEVNMNLDLSGNAAMLASARRPTELPMIGCCERHNERGGIR